MKINQFYFSRSDEENGGWKFVDIGKGVSEEMKSAFQGIHAHTLPERELYALDCSRDYIFVSKVTPTGRDGFGRPKCFIHGYGFSVFEYKELYEDYEALLAFNRFNDGSKDGITEIETLHEDEMQTANESCNVKIHERNLVQAVYTALLKKKSLKIVNDGKACESTVRTLMKTVYAYLPPVLRKYISFATCESGTSRLLTLVDRSEGSGAITYFLNDGSAHGCTSDYDVFLDVLFAGKDECTRALNGMQKYAEEAGAEYDFDAAFYEKAMKYVIMQMQSQKVDEQQLREQLTSLLMSGKFEEMSTAKHLTAVLDSIIEYDIATNTVMNDAALKAYCKTRDNALRDSILNFALHLYTPKCSKDDFDKILRLKADSFELYEKIVKGCIEDNARDFIKLYAEHILEDSKECTYLLETFGEKEIMAVCDAIVESLSDNRDKLKDNMKKIASSPICSKAIHGLFRQNGKEEVDTYLEIVSESSQNYESFKTLDSKVKKLVWEYIVVSADEPDSIRLGIMKRIMLEEPEEYRKLENDLSGAKRDRMLDRFYAEVKLAQASNRGEIVKNLERLQNVSRVSDESVKIAADLYLQYAQKETLSAAEGAEAVRELKAILKKGGIGESRLERLREAFWKKYDLSRWNINEKLDGLFIKGEKKSDLAESFQQAAEFFAGNQKMGSQSDKITNKLKQVLVNETSPLDAKTRERVRAELQKTATDNEFFNEILKRGRRGGVRSFYSKNPMKTDEANQVELYLILNYIDGEKKVSSKLENLSVESAAAYIKEHARGKREGMLAREEIFLQMYEFFSQQRKIKDETSVCESAMKDMEIFAKEFSGKSGQKLRKEMKKISRIPDYSIIAFLSLIVVIALTAAIISDLKISIILKIAGIVIMAFMGVGAAAFDVLCQVNANKFEPKNVVLQMLLALLLAGVSIVGWKLWM